jgi:protein-disulfide isomerase
MRRFNRDILSPAWEGLIKRDIENGKQIGIRGVPKIFINGKELRSRSLQGLEQMITAELRKKK